MTRVEQVLSKAVFSAYARCDVDDGYRINCVQCELREEAEERIEKPAENTKEHNRQAVIRQMKLTLGLFS